MSLITLPAFMTRRREDATDVVAEVAPVSEKPSMRFATRGGAEVHVTGRGFIRCLGCDHTHNWSSTVDARVEANAHAAGCWSMPKPEA